MDLNENYFKQSNSVFCYGLSPVQLAAYAYLCCRAGSKDKCWPGMKDVAARCGCSVNTARAAVQELSAKGFIRTVPTHKTDWKGRTYQTNNTYYILELPPLPNPKPEARIVEQEVAPR